jgi:hypothetical protein
MIITGSVVADIDVCLHCTSLGFDQDIQRSIRVARVRRKVGIRTSRDISELAHVAGERTA